MSASTSNINALRLVAHDRKADGGTVLVRVKPESLKFTCVAAAVGMALDLLQTRPSLRALGLYTLKVADISSHIPRLRNLKNGGEVKVVQEFIAALRASFPHVLITQENGMRAKNARTNKLDCPDTFDPKKAAVLELNNKVCKPMYAFVLFVFSFLVLTLFLLHVLLLSFHLIPFFPSLPFFILLIHSRFRGTA
jgi:hypothetical protein